MTRSRKYHCHILTIAIINTQLIFYTAAGLNNCRNSSLICNLYAIGKREKSIACHNRILQRKAKSLCFLNRLLQCVNSRRLACARRQQDTAFRQNNGV